jgi:hypothetical protein
VVSGSLCDGITTKLVGNSENPRLYSIRRYSVKQSRGIRLDRILLLKATLLAAMVVPALGVRVSCQQEVDPAWYDPWAAQAKVVVQPAQPRVTDH